MGSVSVTHYRGQPSADHFRQRLEALDVRVYLQHWIPDYPSNLSFDRLRRGLRQERLHRGPPAAWSSSRPPAPGSGKMATCSASSITSTSAGVKAGYAKFETFPIWNLPLKHPVNLAYEAATADLDDVNMIDPFHMEAYGQAAGQLQPRRGDLPRPQRHVRAHLRREPLQEPHGHGRVNMAGFCITDDAACRAASQQEIIRRYFAAAVSLRQGLGGARTRCTRKSC